MSPDAYDDLSAADKMVFADAAKLGAAASRKYAADAEQSGVVALHQAGMQVVATIDRARFAAATASATPEYERQFGRDQIEQIRQVA